MNDQINWEDLQYFGVVAATLSIRQAADIAKVSPATLSRRVVNLEERLGQALFVRKAHGLVLTDCGRQLFGISRAVTTKMEEVEQFCRVGARTQIVRIAGPPSYVQTRMIPALNELYNRIPNIQIIFENTPSIDQRGANAPDLQISTSRLTCNVAADHRLRASRSSIYCNSFLRSSDPKSAPLLLWGQSWPDHAFLNGLLLRRFPESTRLVVFDELANYLDALLDGVGFGVLDTEIASKYPQLEILDPAATAVDQDIWITVLGTARSPRLAKQIANIVASFGADSASMRNVQNINKIELKSQSDQISETAVR